MRLMHSRCIRTCNRKFLLQQSKSCNNIGPMERCSNLLTHQQIVASFEIANEFTIIVLADSSILLITVNYGKIKIQRITSARYLGENKNKISKELLLLII